MPPKTILRRACVGAMLMATCEVAAAEQSVYSVFPSSEGDLASQTDWGEVALPGVSDHVKVDQSGTYTLGADLSIASVTVASAEDVVFDFRNGNYVLTLNSMCEGWGNAKSLFHYHHLGTNPTVTFRGGIWKSASNSYNFLFVPLGLGTANHYKQRPLFVVTNSCVISNVSLFCTSRRASNARTFVVDGGRLYGKKMTLYDVAGTNNVLEIGENGAVTLSSAFYCDGEGSSGASYLLNDRVDVHGADARLVVKRSGDGVFVGRMSSGLGMLVRDGGTLDTPHLFMGSSEASPASSNNWIEVRDGGTITTGDIKFNGPGDRFLVSNAVCIVTNKNFTMGASAASGNEVRISGESSTFSLRPDYNADVFGRYGHHNTFVLENGATWSPQTTPVMFFYGSNNVFRICGTGTVFDNASTATDGTKFSTKVGPADLDSNALLPYSRDNVIEILDGAEFRANWFFVHGQGTRVVVSNATLTAGSYPVDGGEAYSVWLGRSTSSGVTLVIQGSTPKVRSLHGEAVSQPLRLQNASRLRYEIPREGYADGYAPVELAYIDVVSTTSSLEISCDEWAARQDRDNRELVLFRGIRTLLNSDTLRNWFASQNLALPENVTCFVRDNELVLRRKVLSGLRITFW